MRPETARCLSLIHIFALFLGVAATLIGEKGKAFLEFNSSLAEVMFKVTSIVMKTAPLGIFALIAVTAAKYGPAVLAPFAKVIFAVYLGCFLQVVIVYSGLITGIVHKSPLWFLKGVREAMLAAFVTRTSAGVLPISMNNVQKMCIRDRLNTGRSGVVTLSAQK